MYSHNLPTLAPGLPQIGRTYRDENYGLIQIDWKRGFLVLELRDLKGEVVIRQQVELKPEKPQ